MLTVELNELLTRTGPGTPMGETMRRYWIPALLSRDLESDGPPVRVGLLGERLVAFRDTGGLVGLVDEFCAHRRTSLFLGRNEEHGIRCIYHGWKYDVHGNCVDMMNEPGATNFMKKVHLTAYPTVELGGVVWAYLGPPDKRPALPMFAWTSVPETHRHVSRIWQECNWLQGLEGGMDNSHAPILHRLLTTDTSTGGLDNGIPFARGKVLKLDYDLTDYGFRYAGIRPLEREGSYVRTYHYVMPFTQIRPAQFPNRSGERHRTQVHGHMWVPIDDENCMVYNWKYSYSEKPLSEEERLESTDGNGPEYADASNEYRSYYNRRNNWQIDRHAQRTISFSGVRGVNTQDRAVQEAMGPTVDRSKEHLGPADRMAIVTRDRLLQAVRTVQDGGDPPGGGDSYYGVRAVENILAAGVEWRNALLAEMYP